MIVGDDTAKIERFADILTKAGILSTSVSQGGRTGIDRAISSRPDLIIVSNSLPDMDIADFCSLLQDNPETSAVPVIIEYGNENEKSGAETLSLELGVDYIIDPLENRSDFIWMVKSYVDTIDRSKISTPESKYNPTESLLDYDNFVYFISDKLKLSPDKREILLEGNRNSIYASCELAGINPENSAKCLAEYSGLNYLPMIDPECIVPDIFTVPFSRSKLVIAATDPEGGIVYILSNPFDIELKETIELVSDKEAPVFALTQPESIVSLLSDDSPGNVEIVSSTAESEYSDSDDSVNSDEHPGMLTIDREPTEDDINKSPIKYIADRILFASVRENSSDIHIEPKENRTVVRFRINGDMKDKFSLKPVTGKILISRFKVLADMDIAERRKPQDGALKAIIDSKYFKMRLATTSTPNGESLVIRLLDMDSKPLKLSELGMTEEQSREMYDVSEQHTGAIIVVGTTGSGKSTTLYSLISSIDVQNKSLMTIEDPVEYELKDANQQEVNEKAGVTFEALLKSAVRQDPDIVYLGEIRDPFTAKTVMDLASTGHLTFGTLHSANTATALGRLERLGVKRGDILDSVLLIEAQRLIKRLCPHCMNVRAIKPDEVETIGYFTDDVPDRLADPVGCSKCNEGFIGRQGIYEILRFDPEVIEIVKNPIPVSEIRKRLHDNGQYIMSDHAVDLLRDFKVCYQDVYRLVFLEEMRLTGKKKSVPVIDESKVRALPDELPVSQEAESSAPLTDSASKITESKPFAGIAGEIRAAEEKGVESSGQRVLVVDDDDDLREFISLILSNNGYNVTSSGDGVDAIVTLSSQEFDLILSDVDMPNLNGFKLLEVIKNKGIESPVVFLTARDTKEDEIRGYELGAEDYIRKPIHKKTLLLRIGRILGR
jgi:type IV pilus assembly protein PilB